MRNRALPSTLKHPLVKKGFDATLTLMLALSLQALLLELIAVVFVIPVVVIVVNARRQWTKIVGYFLAIIMVAVLVPIEWRLVATDGPPYVMLSLILGSALVLSFAWEVFNDVRKGQPC